MPYKPAPPKSQAALAARLRADLLREVSEVRLVAVIGLILERRIIGTAGDIRFDGDKIDVEAFTADATPRRLVLLRELALAIDLDLACSLARQHGREAETPC